MDKTVKTAWAKLFSWLMIVGVLVLSGFLMLSHELETTTVEYVPLVLIISFLVMVMLALLSFVGLVATEAYRVSRKKLLNADTMLEVYADEMTRTMDLEPMVHNKLPEKKATLVRDGCDYMLRIDYLNVSFRIDVLDKVYALEVEHEPTGDCLISDLQDVNPQDRYYATYWGEIWLGYMHERTLKALWKLADAPSSYWNLYNGH